MKIVFTLLILLTVVLKGLGQQNASFSYTQYSVEDGLPSPEVYQSLQDDEGYMWFVTDRGIARFNGRKFERFTFEDGLKDVTLFNLYKDEKGRIWFSSYNNDIYYYEKGRINRHCLSDSLKKTPYVIGNIYAGEGKITVSQTHGQLTTSDYNCTDIKTYSTFDASSPYFEIVIADHPIFAAAFMSYYPLKGIRLKRIRKKSVVSEYLKCPFNFENSWIYTHLLDSTYFCISNNYLLAFEPGEKCEVLEFDFNLNNALFLDSNSLWVGTTKGVYRYNASNLSQKPVVYLANYSITSIYKDHESGYWFTTHNNGVLYAPNINNKCFSASNGLTNEHIEVVTSQNKHFYLGTYDGSLYSLQPDSEKLEKILNIKYHIQTLISWPDGKIGLGFGSNYEYDPQTGSFFSLPKLSYLQDALSEHNMLVVHRNDSLILINRGSFAIDTVIYNVPNKSYRYIALTTTGILLGSRFGLYKATKDTILRMSGFYPPLGSRISDMISLSDSVCAIATLGAGIVILKDDKVTHHITVDEGLSDNLCNRLFFDKNHLWMATNSGISKFDTDFCPVRSYNTSDGLVSDLIYDIRVDNGWVVAATDKGVSFFKEELIAYDKKEIPIYIKTIKINGIDTLLPSKAALSHRENNFQLSFDAVNFKYRSSLLFRYRLAGFTNWTTTHNNDLEYNSLPPGHYQLQIQAGDGRGWWSANTASFFFTISPPLWYRPWFIVFSILSLTGIFFVIFKLRVNYIKRQQAVLDEISFYQNQALGSQINPHFIFNSLNSVQAYAVKNDSKKLMAFVALFAKLFRSIFEVTSQNMVLLETELELLRRYLEFEKLRFKEYLTYKIVVDESINTFDCYLPPLLIQPLAENAIKHGILENNEPENGMLNIEINRINDQLFIIVSNNGRHFADDEKENILQDKSSRPSGIKLVKKRLALVQKWLGRETKFDILNKPGFTQITLTIPYLPINPKNDIDRFS